MSFKNSVGWADFSLNPIKGRCKGGCWYCYYSGKRGMLNRFKRDPMPCLDLRCFDNLPKKPKKIFLCSTHDLFGSWIEGWWQDLILTKIAEKFHHTFQILTKFPQNINRNIPNNVWLGVTITGTKGEWEAFDLGILRAKAAKIKFISIEPLLKELFWNALKALQYFDWIIIGKLTGYGHKYDPKKEWIEKIIAEAKHYNIPIFLKDNVKDIWQGDLIQEFPE